MDISKLLQDKQKWFNVSPNKILYNHPLFFQNSFIYHGYYSIMESWYIYIAKLIKAMGCHKFYVLVLPFSITYKEFKYNEHRSTQSSLTIKWKIDQKWHNLVI